MMKKLTDFIVNNRYVVLVIFIILSILSLDLSRKVNINYDISAYLPSDSETRIGMDIMEKEFPDVDDSSFKIMFKDLEELEKKEVYDYLVNVSDVTSVDYDESDSYNRDGYTLYVVNVGGSADSEVATSVYNEVKEHYKDYEVYMSGDIYDRNHSVLPLEIVFLAIFCAMIILIIMCESYIEPFLFLFAIGMAVFLNNGTNIIFDSVSNITSSISAILQMALSMDYSIMLINRYRQEREKDDDKVSAMKKALYNAFKSISSSSITTIVGLVVLVFMSFTIGRDLGLVLAKGVLFSLISIFCCLPGLILLFDKLIKKTSKKTLNINLDKLGSFSYKFRKIAIIFFIIAFIGSYLLKGNLGILYAEGEANKVKDVFSDNNQIAIIYKNEYEDIVSKYCQKLEDNEKVDNVICYGNTIGEKLTYKEMNKKISSLGEDLEIDDYLLKIIYYSYYNSDVSNKMSFKEFVSFIMTNDMVDFDTKNDISKLSNFTSLDEINKKRSINEIADILDMDISDVKDIFIYYGSKNNNIELTISEFISFIENDVLTNSKYADQISEEMIDNLNMLSNFTDKKLVNKKINSSEMANIFGMDEEVVNNLYFYYVSVNGVDLKLSINEFSSFVLENIDVDSDTKEKIVMLNTYSNKEFINKEMSSLELSNVFGVSEDMIKQLLLLKYSNRESSSKYSLNDFITNVIYLKNNSDYFNDFDISELEKLSVYTEIDSNKLFSKSELSSLFSSDLVDMIYLYSSFPDNYELTCLDFIDINLNNFSSYLDDDSINNLKMIRLVVDNSVKYSSNELSSILGINSDDINKMYALIDFYNGNISNWSMSPYEFVMMIITNNDNDMIKNSISEEELNNLELLLTIMNNSDTKYSYQELSYIVGIDEVTLKNIYTLYSATNLKLNPYEFISFILEHKSDEILSSSLDGNTIKELTLLQKVMTGFLNNSKYSSLELSKLLGINKEQLDLIYSLYDTDSNKTLSLYEVIDLLVSDIMNNSYYSDNFDSDTKDKVNTIKGIMDDIIADKKYSSKEIYNLLTKFSNNTSYDMISLLYIYHGSENNYDNSWKLTVEEFISYLNKDILNDNKFNSFIESDTKEMIREADNLVRDAKDLLVSKNYSRVILNTSYLIEGEETFNFIKDINSSLDSEHKDIYVIGDSPMAFDISLTFDDELNFITILTMISIFIVVALTFKSIIIPFILIFIIQCAIYMIMGILSVAGESVYFIALLIVQSILMGATIDYAILYTSYYLEHRKKMGVKEAIKESYNKSIHTILTSSLILIIVTLIVGYFASATAAKICRTLSHGTICSTLLILLLLPGIIALFDRFIVKDKQLKIK